MKDGHLQQVSDAQTLYDDPHNEFVASFLGNPPINKLYGYIKDGKFVLEDGSATVNIDNPNVKEGQTVVLGIRPEAIQLNQPQVDLTAVIKQRYTMGKEELAFVNVGNQTIRVYLSNDYEFAVGDSVNIKLRKKGSFLFDRETGARI